MSKWQPIETAPRDGTVFLACRGSWMREAHIMVRPDGEMWQFGAHGFHAEYNPNMVPTHWMPLPAPPEHAE